MDWKLVICVVVIGMSCVEARDENTLLHLKNLDGSSDVLARPVRNYADQCVVKFSIILVGFDLDADTNTLTSRFFLNYGWTDASMTWNPQDYDGIDTLHPPVERIWFPRLKLWNGLKQEEYDNDVDAVIYSDGKIVYVVPVTTTTRCTQADSEYTCNLRFGSWSHDLTKIDPQLPSDVMDTSFYLAAPQWELTSNTMKRNAQQWKGFPETYVDIQVEMKIKPSSMENVDKSRSKSDL